MRYAIIENEIIVNVIEADKDFVARYELAVLDENNEASVGGKYIDGEFSPAPFIVTEDAETL